MKALNPLGDQVGGRLFHRHSQWKEITADPFVLGSVQGHLLELKERPPLVESSAKCEVKVPKKLEAAMQSEVDKLVSDGNVEIAPKNKGFHTYPFLVPRKCKKRWRFIMNLKPLNKYMNVKTFRMVTIREIKTAIRQGWWGVLFDVESAYCHIPMAKRHRCFLRFRWKGTTYQFKSLPFGLATAPKTFTRTTRPILLKCRKLGIILFIYIDDGLILAPTKEQAQQHGEIVIALMERLGFKISYEKSQLIPVQKFQHLGLIWDTQNMTTSLPQDKIEKIQDKAKEILKNPTPRRIMQILGQINFAAQGMQFAKLRSRPLQFWLQKCLKGPSSLFQRVEISNEARRCLEMWATFKPEPKPLGRTPCQEVVVTDACPKGFGGQIDRKTFKGLWPGKKGKYTHINLLELETVWKAVQEFEEEIQGRAVTFQIDNTTAVAYLMNEGGTRSKQLNNLATKILLRCEELGCQITPAYLRGIANLKADALSRNQKAQEWHLHKSAFRRIVKRWGTPTVDLFASKKTKQLECYFSLDRTNSQAAG